MTIDEAIEILTLDSKNIASSPSCNLENAQKLGTEALKATKSFRRGIPVPALWQLPGETKD